MSNIILKELYVDNFKSFHKSKFEFGKVNCLIAPNNAGKSNLVEVLEILNSIINKGYSSIFSKCLNNNNYRFNNELITIIALFDLHSIVLIDDYLISYQFETTIDAKINNSTNNNGISTNIFNNGRIKGIKISKKDLIKKPQFSMVFNQNIEEYLNKYSLYLEELSTKRFFTINKNIKKADELYNIILNTYDTKVNITRVGEVFIPTLNVFESTDIFSSFYFHPQTIKKQQNYETNFLLKDGTNLAYFLNTVDENTFDDIKTSIIWEVELIDSMEIIKGSIPTIVFKENVNGNIKDIIYQKVSDGTINLLAIVTAIMASKSNCLVFEEPERHLHMKTLYKIISHFRESDKQIFFTTHSSEMLNDLKLNEIIFLYRDDDGNTQGKRAKDIENIKKIMKIYKNDLVELIRTGIFDDLALEDNL